jgi:hypothetical protein
VEKVRPWFGRAVKNSTLDRLEVHKSSDVDARNDDLVVAAARCIGAFFTEVKHNTTIKDANLKLTAGASLDDLIVFIQNNKTLNWLWLGFDEPLSLEQSTALSNTVSSLQLENVSIEFCRFENDGSFEKIL